MRLLHFALLGIASAIPLQSEHSDDYFAPEDIITRDVCIIGGGSSGTYSAISLRDRGKSVVVIEREDVLGGHTNTYIDPATGATYDYGVIVFHDLPIVRDYFARLNVSLTKVDLSAATTPGRFADFRTGEVIESFIPTDPTSGLAAYGQQVAKYPYVEYGFDLPDPVPEELLMKFGDFVKKYNIDSAVYTIFNFGQGLGDILEQPTLYVFKNFGLSILQNIQTGFLTTARGDNGELYRSALAELGDDVLLQSHVVSTDRSGSGCVKIIVDTPEGRKLIKAENLIVTIPPKLANLRGFDLDTTERSLFAQFRNSAYYTSLIRNTGLPDNLTFSNIGVDTAYNLPALPGVYSTNPSTIQGIRDTKYGSPVALPDSKVKANIIATIKRLQQASGFPNTEPEFVEFRSHTPFECTVPTDAIKAGFYKKLYGLQGHKRTYYTGAAFHTQDSSLLWRFTEALLPRITG